jgi:ferredoxin
MATMITSECINCGACEPECPNTAIYQGGVEWQSPDGAMHPALSNDIFYIVPEKCTECVGFFDHEACAAVCPVDCCVPNPDIPEAEAVLLTRARALHPDQTIADDAPSRFRKEGGAAETSAPAPAAAAPAPAAPPPAATAPVAAEPELGGLAIPAPDDWEVPIRCFRCAGEYTVPYPTYRAGVVFRCPHCLTALVPTLNMVRAVRESLEAFHAKWSTAFERFHAQRQRDLEQFEERQRRDLERFESELKAIAMREKAPGAPSKRRGFFAF